MVLSVRLAFHRHSWLPDYCISSLKIGSHSVQASFELLVILQALYSTSQGNSGSDHILLTIRTICWVVGKVKPQGTGELQGLAGRDTCAHSSSRSTVFPQRPPRAMTGEQGVGLVTSPLGCVIAFVCAPTNTWKGQRMSGALLYFILHVILLRQDLSLNLEQGWRPMNPASSCLIPPQR